MSIMGNATGLFKRLREMVHARASWFLLGAAFLVMCLWYFHPEPTARFCRDPKERRRG
jgi:hypothetical protein